MKRICRSFLLFLAFAQLLLIGAWGLERDYPVSGNAGEELLWRVKGSRLTISGNGCMEDWEAKEAPWYEARTEITTVTIGGGVTGVGENAFAHMTNIQRVVFLGDCPRIPKNAFLGVTAKVEYGENQEGWTEETKQNYGGSLSWSSPCSHKYSQNVLAPVCGEKGYTTHRCETCGESYVDQYREALEHEMTEWVSQEGYNGAVRSVCHRGSSLAPENTLVAYELAKKQGYTYVETDVQFTKDGVPVLLHDSTVDRTSNGSGAVADMTYEELKKLDFGGWKGDDYTGTIIPTFEEFLQLATQLHLKPYVELKYGMDPAQVTELVGLVKGYGMEQDVTFISFDDTLLNAVGQQLPGVRLGYLVMRMDEHQIALASTLKQYGGAVFLDCSYRLVTEEWITALRQAELELEVWTVNDADWIHQMDPYITGITSDQCGITQESSGAMVRYCRWCDNFETKTD